MSRLLPADGRVAVAVATTGADAATCLAHARAAAAAGADVVELRADLLAGPDPLGDAVGLAARVVGAAGRAPARRRRAPRLQGQPRPRPGPPAGRRLAGARAADLAGDGRPRPDGARARPTASLGLMRMNQDVLRHTPQALAHSLSVPPAHACST